MRGPRASTGDVTSRVIAPIEPNTSEHSRREPNSGRPKPTSASYFLVRGRRYPRSLVDAALPTNKNYCVVDAGPPVSVVRTVQSAVGLRRPAVSAVTTPVQCSVCISFSISTSFTCLCNFTGREAGAPLWLSIGRAGRPRRPIDEPPTSRRMTARTLIGFNPAEW